MRNAAIGILGLAALLATPTISAQPVTVDCFAPVDCHRIISPVLTPAFLRALPPARYRLVIFGSIHRYDDAHAAAYAVAGVSERVARGGIEYTVLPLKRYSASVPVDRPGFTEADMQRALGRAVKAAVERMMQACASSDGCQVHKPYQ